jgi:hypothetical protein
MATALTLAADPGFMSSWEAALGDNAMKMPGFSIPLVIVIVTDFPFSRLVKVTVVSRGKELHSP